MGRRRGPSTDPSTIAGQPDIDVPDDSGDVDTEIDLIEVQSTDELPDAENLDDPTIAYVNDDDDYVGVFQE